MNANETLMRREPQMNIGGRGFQSRGSRLASMSCLPDRVVPVRPPVPKGDVPIKAAANGRARVCDAPKRSVDPKPGVLGWSVMNEESVARPAAEDVKDRKEGNCPC